MAKKKDEAKTEVKETKEAPPKEKKDKGAVDPVSGKSMKSMGIEKKPKGLAKD